MQGAVALDDLVRSDGVEEVLAADSRFDALRGLVEQRGYGSRVKCSPLDARNDSSLDALFSEQPDVAIDLLPVDFIPRVADTAIRHRVPLLNTFFVLDELRARSARAEEAGVAILPEFGMDPGIDLLLLADAVRDLDEVRELHSYGGGIPAPEAANNAIRYKVSWTLEGVLRAYHHPSRIIRESKEVRIAAGRLFEPENIHVVEIDGLGPLEAYTNGDAIEYSDALGIDPSSLAATGRYSLRWPGHSEFWRKIAGLHLLDDDPVMVGGIAVDRIAYLAAALGPHLQYEEGESDLAIIRVVAKGLRDGVERTVVHEVIDRRDQETGFTAMGRLVGFTASIGAQMLALGEIPGACLLSPLRDVPIDRVLGQLRERGVQISTRRS
jgi:saccharopine dehydrogenase-like NADP-dependent oxidoreductase